VSHAGVRDSNAVDGFYGGRVARSSFAPPRPRTFAASRGHLLYDNGEMGTMGDGLTDRERLEKVYGEALVKRSRTPGRKPV
jgi:hypothetical protein